MLIYLSVTILVLLLLSIPVGATLVLLGIGIDIFFSPFPLTKALGQTFWSAANSFLLLSIPLFVLMGQLIVKSGVAAKAYQTLDYWLSWLPVALERRHIHLFFCHVRVFCCHRGHHFHRRTASAESPKI